MKRKENAHGVTGYLKLKENEGKLKLIPHHGDTGITGVVTR